MIISNSHIGFSASYQRSEQVSERESLELYRTDADGQVRLVETGDQAAMTMQARVTAASIQVEAAQPALETADKLSDTNTVSDAEITDPGLRLKAMLVAMLSGREITLVDLGSLDTGAVSFTQNLSSTESTAPSPGDTGMRYEKSSRVDMSESSSFTAAGTLITSDGASFEIALGVNMNYQLSEEQSLVITAGVQLKDPLVVNFGGTATELSQQQVEFDIDADNKTETINFVSSDSGFLMLDRNGDGVATNGSELFGAISGNGFADLSGYDEDGNGFIDEGDSVFAELQIWIRGQDGQDQYASLADKGIGALYLGSIETPFSLYESGSELRGEIRASGLFIREDGSAGTLQQIDLVV